jgi:hypothetical protein
MLDNSFKTTAHHRITASLYREECGRSCPLGYLIFTIYHGYERSQPITLRRIPKTPGDSGIRSQSKIDLQEPSTLPDVLKTCVKLKAELVLHQCEITPQLVLLVSLM